MKATSKTSSTRRSVRLASAAAASVALASVALPLSLPAQTAAAAPCPDVEVVFARGTAEPQGPGIVGTSLAAALRAQAPGKSIGEYAVNYPASANFDDRLGLAHNVIDGVRDTQSHIASVAATCSNTKIVLGGYSQGAAVAGYAANGGFPAGLPPEIAAALPGPIPSAVADHVSAVVLFGKPSDRFLSDVGAPALTLGPQYASKTAQYCVPGDTICDGAPAGQPNGLHVLYPVNGMTVEAANFALARS